MVNQIEEILEDFRIHLFESGRVSSEMTIESYLGNIRQLLEWLQEELELENLGRMLIMSYLKYLKDLGYKATTYNTKINSITNFNSYLKDEGICPT